MPDKEDIKTAGGNRQPLARPGTGGAWQADRLKLTDLDQPAISPDGSDKTPIHLINANVLSWWAKDSRALRRKGDNFVLSPLYCGSDMTKWKRTENVANNRLTLATAMAVSGAAVNPQGGFAGQGPTTSWPVSLAMAFLSLRLGYWLVWRPIRMIPRFGKSHPSRPYSVAQTPRIFGSQRFCIRMGKSIREYAFLCRAFRWAAISTISVYTR